MNQSRSGAGFLALAALSLTAVLWASAFPATKAALAGYAPGDVVLLRIGVAGLCFALALVPAGRARLREWRSLRVIVPLGLLGIFGYQVLLSVGQGTITASAAGLVITAVPICTAILAGLLAGERLSLPGWCGIGLGASGVTMITLSEGLDLGSVQGIGLVLLAALVAAIYFVLQKPVLRREAPVVFLAWAIWISVLPALWAAPGLLDRVMNAPLEATLAAVYLGVFPQALGYGLYTFALARVPASLASSFVYLQPPISVLIAWVWLEEQPTRLIFVGGGLALLGVALVSRYGTRRTVPVAEVRESTS